MNNRSNLTLLVAFAAVGLTACAGVTTSQYSYDSSYKLNQPVKDAKCYDASVLLSKDLAASKDIARKVLAAIDASIKVDSDAQIDAQRNRHVGVLVGSGGEELTLTFKAETAKTTFVTAATKTGFVGGAGQKAWSCQIVDEMAKMAAK